MVALVAGILIQIGGRKHWQLASPCSLVELGIFDGELVTQFALIHPVETLGDTGIGRGVTTAASNLLGMKVDGFHHQCVAFIVAD